MLTHLETLIELHKQGTMLRTSSILRISQSTVSKRISALESHYGTKLIEKKGRNVTLTEEARLLLNRISPLLSELRESIYQTHHTHQKTIQLGVSESILSSWGAHQLKQIFDLLDINVEYHCHRSPLVVEKVESGLYDIGLCAGKITNSRSLIADEVALEEMVLIAQSPKDLKKANPAMISIETSSSTWKSIQNKFDRSKFKPTAEIESFFSVAQLALAGYGIGLVPLGVANTMKIPKNCISHFQPKIFRPIQVVYKKSKLEKPHFQELLKNLKKLNKISV